jgi:hypothetical protein
MRGGVGVEAISVGLVGESLEFITEFFREALKLNSSMNAYVAVVFLTASWQRNDTDKPFAPLHYRLAQTLRRAKIDDKLEVIHFD